MVAIAILVVAYVVLTEALDWFDRMKLIEERWPRVGAFLENRKVRLILLLVAIGLFVRIYSESGLHNEKLAQPSGESSVPNPESKKILTEGDCSPVVDGKGNTVTATCGDPQKKPALANKK